MPTFRQPLRAGRAALPLVLLALQAAGCAGGRAPADASPATSPAGAPAAGSVAELLAADRAFAAASARGDLVSGVTRMLDADVYMPVPGGAARGAAAAEAALRRNPDNARSRMTWTPIRGGVSGDGEHGFTYGYTTVTRPDGTPQPGKYVAYWLRRADGWRVAAYRHTRRAPGPVSLAERPPAVPAPGLARGDAAAVARYVEELKAVEREFSAEAQSGIGAAFVKYGAPDAANIGGPNDASFRFGAQSIGASLDAGAAAAPRPTTLTWAAADAHAASTGDLGVTLGTITVVQAATAAQPADTGRVAYFTIWRRAGPGQAWRYVAE